MDNPTCETCRWWEHRGHAVAAGGVKRNYGLCTNSVNDVRMSIGFEKTEPMHDLKWSWDRCPEHARKEPTSE